MKLFKPSLNWLLACVPVTIGLHFAKSENHTLIFILACISIIPIAGWMGKGTEHLAEKTGEGIGGLLNATFGNAAELIIALMALQKGMYDVVKASITGSILGNILLVMGMALLAGGVKFKEQKFNAAAARSQSTMLLLAAVALVLPAVFHMLGGQKGLAKEGSLSLEISIVLLATYAFGLIFSLKTHKHLFSGNVHEKDINERDHSKPWSMGKSIAVLAIATFFVGWISEIMVGSIEHAAHTLGMSNIFIGVIVVAVIGNAAEHSTAILFAMKNRMDLSVGIAIGSSIQVALFVAPVLVLASYFIGPSPMNLVFSPAEVVAVTAAVFVTAQITNDGESNWLEGLQLLSVYILMGMMFYFL